MIPDIIESGIHVLRGMLQGGYRSCDRDLPVGPETRKTEVIMRYILFFNKKPYRHRLDTSIYYFRRIREPYPAMLCPSGSFFVPASTARISRTFMALKQDLRCPQKPGVAAALFAFVINYIVNM